MWDDITTLGSAMDPGLLITTVGVIVAGFAAVLGIWMERDDAKPPRYAYALSILILLATVVSVAQSYFDAKEGEKLEEDMARLIQQMDKIATNSHDPALQNLIASELSAQSRSNPDIVQKLAQRVSDDGGDPTALLGKHLDASEVEGIARKGLVTTKKPRTKVAKKKARKDAGPSPKEVKAQAEKRALEQQKAAAAVRARAAAAQKAAAAAKSSGDDAGAEKANAAGARAAKAMKARTSVVGSREAPEGESRRRRGGGDDGDKKEGAKNDGAKKKAAPKKGRAAAARGRGR